MKKLDILYEDDDLIIVNKRYNLLSIGTTKEKYKTLYRELSDFVKKRHKTNKVFIVNRLDRETSGIVVFAKRYEVKERLQLNWENVKRYYIAIVEGKVKDADLHLKLLENKITYKTEVNNKGVDTHTKIRSIKTFNKNTFIELELLTGKKHQIRASLSHLNCPVVGDKKYGALTNPYRRMMLHAYKIEFNHPVTGKLISIETPVPNHFIKMLEAL